MIIQRCTWLIVLFLAIQTAHSQLTVSNQDIKVPVNGNNTFYLQLSQNVTADVDLALIVNYADLIKTDPTDVSVSAEINATQWLITVFGLNAGHAVITVNATPSQVLDASDAFVRVTIEKSDTLYHISAVVGWVYFLAWSVSFYPQIYSNYKRKSVVGLNFDFLSLNIVGFVMYSLFNCGLYWIPEVQQEYFNRYPTGLNPVQVNDIFFAIHAVFATAITIVQCFIYERESQKVSITARVIHGFFFIFVLVSVILAGTNTITWLDFLYYCSYVKLAITLIKYVPQAYYNYKRKSTIGWSIGNIFLDFTGGMLSMLQMILNAYNYDDWESIFGDPTKFGLGFFSVAFDIFFIIQHYALYRKASAKMIDLTARV